MPGGVDLTQGKLVVVLGGVASTQHTWSNRIKLKYRNILFSADFQESGKNEADSNDLAEVPLASITKPTWYMSTREIPECRRRKSGSGSHLVVEDIDQVGVEGVEIVKLGELSQDQG